MRQHLGKRSPHAGVTNGKGSRAGPAPSSLSSTRYHQRDHEYRYFRWNSTSVTTGTEIVFGLVMPIFVSLFDTLQASECKQTDFGGPEANG